MTSRELKRWLTKKGATYASGKGGHLKIALNGKRSILPMHSGKEIGKGLLEKIKKDLNLD